MTRISKQNKKRNLNPKKRKPPIFLKTGPQKEPFPYKNHTNCINANNIFIPKIKGIKNV